MLYDSKLHQRIIKVAHFNSLRSYIIDDLKSRAKWRLILNQTPRRGAVLNIDWYKCNL